MKDDLSLRVQKRLLPSMPNRNVRIRDGETRRGNYQLKSEGGRKGYTIDLIRRRKEEKILLVAKKDGNEGG